jgi:hypothetical protein
MIRISFAVLALAAAGAAHAEAPATPVVLDAQAVSRPDQPFADPLQGPAPEVQNPVPPPAQRDGPAIAVPGEGVEPVLPILEAADVDLGDFIWVARPVVVFADSPADPAFRQQMQMLARDPGQLIERDVVVVVDTDPAARSAVREKLRPRGFMLVLIDKDGQIKQRKPLPWDVRELSRAIDKMPLRREELKTR